MTFEMWLRHVDGLLLKVWGVTSRDIADRPWHVAYDSGASPAVVVREIVREGAEAL